MSNLRKAFTLMEVNLAILIMAGGILSIVGLYSLGYRENRQSREDVAGAAFADAVISPIVMAASATNLKWSAFKDIKSYPSENGWADYFNSNGLVTQDPTGTAKSVFGSVMDELKSAAIGTLDVDTSWPEAASAGLRAGLVVMHDDDSAVLRIAFRASRNTGELMALPIYYTEVRFQGVADE